MLQALLHGKLSRDHENIEDLLTSNTFGLLKYCDPAVTLRFLAKATLLDGSPAIDPVIFLHQSASIVDWQFWPYWSEEDCNPCEPDVVLTLEGTGGHKLYVLIEAKLNAGKSSFRDQNVRPSDQLAREWDNLIVRAHVDHATPILIYLTGHFSCPRAEIADSLNEFKEKRGSEPVIGWLSWRALHGTFGLVPMRPMEEDIAELLTRMDLSYFHGTFPVKAQQITWRFRSWALRWRMMKTRNISWSFK